MCIPCLSPSLAFLPGLWAQLSAGASFSPKHRAPPELLPTTQLHTGVLSPLPFQHHPRKRPCSLCSKIPPAHLGTDFFSQTVHWGLMLPIVSRPDHRNTSSTGRKPHFSSIRLSSKSTVLGMILVFLGDSILVFKLSFPSSYSLCHGFQECLQTQKPRADFFLPLCIPPVVTLPWVSNTEAPLCYVNGRERSRI